MGKKAINLLAHTVMIILTVILAVFTVMALRGAAINPNDNGFYALMALGMPVLLGANVLMAIYWIFRKRFWFVVPLAMLGINYEYYPRVFQWPSKEQEARAQGDSSAFTVATYNVNYFRFDKIEKTLEQVGYFMQKNEVDLVCFQEFSSSPKFTVDSIAQSLGLPYYALGKNSTGYNDLAIFSRYPLSNKHAVIFKGSPNSAMWADVKVDGRMIRVINAHLQTTSVNWEKDDLQRQLALGTTEDQARAAIRISNIMKKNFRLRAFQVNRITELMDTTGMPVIYCGDTNDTPSSYAYSQLIGGGKRIDGFIQAGNGYAYTFHSMKKLLRIDYIFYTPEIRGIGYYSPYRMWSDHNPVIMQLELPG